MVVPAGDPGAGPDRLGGVRDLPCVPAVRLLRREVQLPDAVLLAVRLTGMCAGVGAFRTVPARRPVRRRLRRDAVGAVRRAHAAVPAALPVDLLLLPQGLLPGVLDVSPGLCGRRTPRLLLG